MSESRNSVEDDSRQSASTPLRRERAPTITIDTSAVTSTADQNPPPPQISGPSQSLHSANHVDPTGDTSALLNGSGVSPTDTRSAPSVRSYASSEGREHDSRPTSPSPHNVLSPNSKMTDSMLHSNYLSVPGARSRGNSLESEDSSHSNGGDSRQNGNHGSLSDSAKTTIENYEEALQPDPGREAEFEVENNSFAFSPGQLNKLLNPKSLGAFYALGGIAGLEKGLRTDVRSGLSLDETELDGTVSFEDATARSNSVPKPATDTPPQTPPDRANTTPHKQDENAYADRKRVFGPNKLPEKKTKSILELAWLAYNDKVLILLTVAAVISLALGIYQSVTAKPGEPRVQWVEGVAIIVAILIVVVVGAANDWQKERQFVKLNKKKEDRMVKVIRSGKMTEISVHDILVGDLMHLEPGDLVPVDGIYISGHNIKCDESSATGESDVLRKSPAHEVYGAIERHENLAKQDPFIVSGAKVSEGVGTFLVTAVGVHSTYGKTMMSLQDEGQTTPLQTKLNVLAEYIAKLGLAAGLLLFVVLFIKFLAQLKGLGNADQKGQAFLQIFIVAVTVIVVAVPEGLPLAVTLALAFATTRMLKDNNLVRLLRACETMGNATTICSDKTGTLTENKMTAVVATLGTSTKFGGKSQASSPAPGNEGRAADSENALSPSEFANSLSPPAKQLLLDSIVLNSTAFEGEQEGTMTFIGSKTETALLGFARTYLGLGSLSEARDNANVAQMVPFDSGRKCMAVVIKMDNGKKYRMLVKGASEVLLAKSTRIVRDPTQNLDEGPLDEKDRSTLDDTINHYATQSLRTIGLVYRDFTEWPPRGAPTQEEDRSLASFDHIFKDMIFFGVFGIQDPLRAGVTESVHQCQRAGVFVRMVTGDNIVTAKAIAQECGIFTPGGVAIEGPKFRKLSSRQMTQIIPRLQVLARSSPDDKKILVTQLKKLGETVAVTGDGTNDAQALKTADVGFSMGITGTEVAKEASDIILMDDNFASIVKAMAWGRTVNDAVKKFLQFQITVNITAVLLTFISAVASGDEESVLTAVQLLWVNLIMDTFAALALATDPPSPYVLNRRPEPKSAPLITLTMWKMIIGQSIYQLVVTLILNFAGKSILKSIIDFSDEDADTALKTVVFNTFVWMQIFNQWNSRRLDSGLNIFEGIFRNRWFIGIQFIIVGGQILIIFVGGHAFSVTDLTGAQWAVCLILGVISLPVAVIIRLIPDEFIRKLIPTWSRKKGPELIISDEDRRYEWNPALEEIRHQLKFFKSLRGGRMRNLAHKLQHPEEFLPRSRSGSRSRENSAPGTPVAESSEGTPPFPATPDSRSHRRARSRSNSAFGPAAAMAGIVAGSIAGWSPIERTNGEGESFKFDFNGGNVSRQPGIEIHPDTAPDDNVINNYLSTSNTPPSQNPDLLPFFEHAPPAREPSSRSRRSTSRRSQSRSSQSHSHSNSQSQSQSQS
ncbi:Putative P-type calcium ATPase [Aspergillus calidoustus]|uniref:Calcium-transporting ATPase n=1 Tax=Aspergillus calidoustus TaxID=454130 RepID=A0A0U5GTJ0_ASPCI|nr:Putative P-type calcium ATPase [Aspergillus calidoustus]